MHNTQEHNIQLGGVYETGNKANQRTDVYALLRQQGIDEDTDFIVEAGKEIKLFAGDYISASQFQCDDLMYYSSIAITSNDLLVRGVYTSDFHEILLHKFPLGHTFGFSANNHYEITGCNGNPPGVISWRSRMTEIVPHEITMSGAPLRKFGVRAVLKKKAGGSELMYLGPGGEFQLSLLFVKNHQH